MSRKTIIGDLFGGSKNSVYNALKCYKNIDIYTFDINENIQHNKQYVVSLLTVDEFYAFIKEKKIPKPDIIFSSPLCQSFSGILNIGTHERLGGKYNKESDRYEIRDIDEIRDMINKNDFFKYFDPQKQQNRAVIGDILLKNTLEIINKYKPKCWYIENPLRSLMWRVIYTNHKEKFPFIKDTHINVADYNSYDLQFTQKPTVFLSNKRLNLNSFEIKNNTNRSKSNRTSGGSSSDFEQGENVKIPPLLIVDIFRQFKEHMGQGSTNPYRNGNEILGENNE